MSTSLRAILLICILAGTLPVQGSQAGKREQYQFKVKTALAPAVKAVSNSVSVELDAAKLRYRVLLRLKKDTEYDSLELLPTGRGLAPPGARVHVKDDSNQLVECNSARGYSSYELDSGSPMPRSAFRKAPQSGIIYSQWFDIGDLVRGLGLCSKVAPERWAKLMITFSVATHGKPEVSLQGESAWLVLTPANRRRLYR